MLVVADDPLARAGLAAMLSAQRGCAVVGQLAGGPDLEQALDVYRAEAIVWDLGGVPAQAIERLSALPVGHPPVVALLPQERHAREVLAAGARGLLLRDVAPASLVAALVAAAQGIVAIAPELTAALSARDAPPLEDGGGALLTPRELEVMGLMAEGLPNKTIAAQLGVSEHTVKFHVNAILGKLGARSRTEAVTSATRRGLILL